MKVYVVLVGQYSDRHVESVFTDEEQAKLFTGVWNKQHGYDTANIEEYETDVVRVESNYSTYSIQFDEDGAVTQVQKDPYASSINVFDCDRVCVMAEDVEHALKIAYDLRAMKKAEKEGVV